MKWKINLMKRKRVKTIIVLIFALILLLMLASCNNNITDNLVKSEPNTESAENDSAIIIEQEEKDNIMFLYIGEQTLTVTLAENTSAKALRELLAAGSITIDMRDYGGFEKVGDLGAILPENNERITTEPGDLILYQGNSFVIYYAPNTWSLTRLGKINDIAQIELKNLLGDGNVTVMLSLN